ncbi:hypothetical protein B6G00_13985 [Salinivibrio sp. YCSC6]|nr:hypothetical protein B6G00_13985 [Salinivibrio sp. YCSC6]
MKAGVSVICNWTLLRLDFLKLESIKIKKVRGKRIACPRFLLMHDISKVLHPIDFIGEHPSFYRTRATLYLYLKMTFLLQIA